MTYFVNESCISCKYTDCVEVCPVDCFYEGENFLAINPDECIDCGVCEAECPANAILPDTTKAHDQEYIDYWVDANRKWSEKWPVITKKRDPLPEADLYIIATKAAHVRAAGEKIIKEGGEAPVVTIQNGFGSGEILAETIPQDRILLGVAEGFGASIKTPGHAHHSSMTRIRLGLYGGGSSPVLDQITRLWVEAGFPAEQYGDIDQLIWEKFVCNVTLSGACTVTGLTVAELRRDPALWQIAVNCGLEAYAVGKARGVHFSYDDPVAYVTAFADKLGDARPSMSLDHLAKRKSEIDVLNGMVPVMAKALNIPTPVNEVVSALVRHLETKF